MYKELLQSVEKGKRMTTDQIAFFLEQSEKGSLDAVQQAAILAALNTKGIDAKELTAFVQLVSKKMPESIRFPNAIDICGTGGSGLPRINTSTISAFILAALGVPVAKHGNKAASGRFGSFDLLEAMGIRLDPKPQHLALLAQQQQLVFLYARSFHPVMKHFAPVRKAMGVPTVFNLIGPLLNPAQTKRQIIGTAFRDKMELIAQTCKRTGKKRVLVVSGEDGLDEVTLTGKTFVTELRDGKIRKSVLRPSSFGVKRSTFEEITGGTPAVNTQLARDILKGECRTRHLDLVLVNTALALKLAGKTSNLKKAYQMAKSCVESGAAYQQYLSYRQASHAPSILLDIVNHKRREVAQRKKRMPLRRFQKQLTPSQRDFRTALLRNGISLIAEIKKASPSEGVICKGRFNVAYIAKTYEQSGARAISVLTDQKYFGGSLNNLNKARAVTERTPLLCKDFIIDAYQIYEARKHGADAVLLIASILTDQHINAFIEIASSLKMDCLVEVHNRTELERVLASDAEIIGINNRDLHTFKTDLRTTQRLAKMIKGRILVAESGIASRPVVAKLPSKVDAILVGTGLMKSKDLSKKISSLIGKPKPLLKVCGVQSLEEARHCFRKGVDYIGLNFVPTSKRRVSYQLAARITKERSQHPHSPTKIVGVFQNQSIKEINMAADNLGLDYVQLSGDESISDVKNCEFPVIKGVSIERKSDVTKTRKFSKYVEMILLDGKDPGSGKLFDHRVLQTVDFPFLLAGGLNAENINEVVKTVQPIGVDLASGVEKEGKRDLKKISQLCKLLSS